MILSVEKARAKLKAFMVVVYDNLAVTKYMKLPEVIDERYEEKLTIIVEKENEACKAVYELMKTDYPYPIKDFFTDIGKSYEMSKNEECQKFLIEYFSWLADQAEEKAPTLPKLPDVGDIKLPSFTFPKFEMPDFGIAKYIFIIILIILALFALGYSGVGSWIKKE